MYQTYRADSEQYGFGRTRQSPYRPFKYLHWYPECQHGPKQYYYGERGDRSLMKDNILNRLPAPKDELAKVLNVKTVDLHIQTNTTEHRTDRYECTEVRKDDDGNEVLRELVLRRGFTFDMTIEFDRPYEPDKQYLRLEFEFGDDPMPTRGTLLELPLVENKHRWFNPQRWGANITSTFDNSITVKVHIPCNCIVGEWDLAVKTYVWGADKTSSKDLKSYSYDINNKITILFNPWCKKDECYLTRECLLDEYIMNENGILYKGVASNISGQSWFYGQFETGILEAALYVMKSGFGRNETVDLGNPVIVARRLAMMMNSSRGGVLAGRWKGSYKDGKRPVEWNDSPSILKQFMETKTPVKYGQCWVFSALVTTVCRALGIPCRSVTTFVSGIDREKSNTIDRFIDLEGNDVTRNFTNDAFWNFHVWNEVWMARPDLQHRDMDGWQALDSCPQEISFAPGDPFPSKTCGPCPVKALKEGRCDVNYDAGFIFAEVNADEILWQVHADGKLSVLRIRENKIGRHISTKKPDGKPYLKQNYDPTQHNGQQYRKMVAETTRLDITDNYKYTEGSEAERIAVERAYATAIRPRGGAYNPPKEQDVKLKLIVDNELMIGSDVTVRLGAINVGRQNRCLDRVIFKARHKTYSGHLRKTCFTKEINNVEIAAGKEESVKVTVPWADYLPDLQDHLYISAYIVVRKTETEPEIRNFKSRDLAFMMPVIHIKGPHNVKVGTTAEYEVSLENPLSVPLTRCVLTGRSSAFTHALKQTLPDISVGGSIQQKFKFTTKQKQGAHTVQFTLDTKEMKDITDVIVINVDE